MDVPRHEHRKPIKQDLDEKSSASRVLRWQGNGLERPMRVWVGPGGAWLKFFALNPDKIIVIGAVDFELIPASGPGDVMTAHWNSRRGSSGDADENCSSVDETQGPKGEAASTAEVLLSMRKVPDKRPAKLARAKKLLADPDYPPRKVTRAVAGLLLKHWEKPVGE